MRRLLLRYHLDVRIGTAAATALVLGLLDCSLLLELDGLSSPEEPDASVFADGRVESPPDGEAPDATEDADSAVPPCDRDATFGPARPITSLNTALYDELWPRLSSDERTMVLGTQRPPSPFGMYLATRSSLDAGFGPPLFLANLAAGAFDTDPMLSFDGSWLFFASDRDASPANLYVAPRTGSTSFGAPQPITALNTGGEEYQPFLTADGKWIWFTRVVGPYAQILRAPVMGSSYGDASAVAELASEANDWLPVLSGDDSTIYFASTRDGGVGDYDIWVASRASASVPFENLTPVRELNSPKLDAPGYLSPDGCRLYFHSNRGGATLDLYVASKLAP